VRFPPSLYPGANIRIFAGSSPFDRTLMMRGAAWLRKRYNVSFRSDMVEREGYLAGSDDRRTDELNEIIRDPNVQAIIAARGGYGLTRIAHRLDWNAFAAHPKWIIGFSDVTALHVEAQRREIASIHGANANAFGRCDQALRTDFIEAVEYPAQPRHFGNLTSLIPGTSCGTLAGGNLALLHDVACTGRLQLPDNTILFLEDIAERPYRIDRMLSALLVGGHLRSVVGVIAGEWEQCTPGSDGITVQDVLRERFATMGVPVVYGAPMGHGRNNRAIHLGSFVQLNASDGWFTSFVFENRFASFLSHQQIFG
jgi:muramoyltetrapeptide carboxypeptidase